MLSLLPYPSPAGNWTCVSEKKWNEKEQSNNQLLIRKLVFCHEKINLRGNLCWDRIFKFLLSIPHLKLQQQCLKDCASRALPEFAEICLLHTPINSECFLLDDMRIWHRGCNRKEKGDTERKGLRTGASLGTQTVKSPPAVQMTWVWSLVEKNPWRREPHSNILAWRNPWTEEPSRL